MYTLKKRHENVLLIVGGSNAFPLILHSKGFSESNALYAYIKKSMLPFCCADISDVKNLNVKVLKE
jgi:hypothetical protein